MAFTAPPIALTVAGRAFEVFPYAHRCSRASSRFRRVPPPSLAASTTSARPPGVATRSTTRALCELCVSSNAEAAAAASSLTRGRGLHVDHPSTSSRLLLAVPSVGSPFSPSTPDIAPKRCAIGSLVPTRESRSVLVVSHHLDGFLRTDGADTVAARCRPWGPPCFDDPLTCTRSLSRELTGQHERARSHGALTPRSFSLPAAPAPLTASPEGGASREAAPSMPFQQVAPPLRSRPEGLEVHRCVFSTTVSTSRSCSADRSVAIVHRCQRPTALSFHGLLFPLPSLNPHPTRKASVEVACCAKQLTVEEFTSKSSTEVLFPR